jgi:hypothetical protein
VYESITRQNIADIQRLPDNDSVDVLREELPELIDVHIRGREQGLIEILTRARDVVMLGQDIVLGRGKGKTQTNEGGNGEHCPNPLNTWHLACRTKEKRTSNLFS